MRNLLLTILMALLCGCVTTQAQQTQQQRGTAEIILKDGGKWVHVLGTGVSFPLLGAWARPTVQTMKNKDGAEVTAIAVLGGEMSGPSRAVAFVNHPQASDSSLANMVYLGDYNADEAGTALCQKANLPLKEAFLVSDHVFCAHCQGTSYEYVGFFVEASDSQEVTIQYWGAGFAHEGAYSGFQEMMRRVEINCPSN